MMTIAIIMYKKKVIFHIVSTLSNSIVISLIFKFHQFIIDSYIDDLFFLRNERNFSTVYLFSIFLASPLATFLIYKSKKYNNHLYLIFFLIFGFVCLLIFYDLTINYNGYIEYYEGMFDYLIKKSFYILIKEETLIASLVISISLYSVQTIIGKKLLPTWYKKY